MSGGTVSISSSSPARSISVNSVRTASKRARRWRRRRLLRQTPRSRGQRRLLPEDAGTRFFFFGGVRPCPAWAAAAPLLAPARARKLTRRCRLNPLLMEAPPARPWPRAGEARPPPLSSRGGTALTLRHDDGKAAKRGYHKLRGPTAASAPSRARQPSRRRALPPPPRRPIGLGRRERFMRSACKCRGC